LLGGVLCGLGHLAGAVPLASESTDSAFDLAEPGLDVVRSIHFFYLQLCGGAALRTAPGFVPASLRAPPDVLEVEGAGLVVRRVSHLRSERIIRGCADVPGAVRLEHDAD